MHRLRVLAVVIVLLVFPLIAHAATVASNPDGTSTVSDQGYTFKNFQLGALPSEYCPDPNSPCQNSAAEPAIRTDNFGNFFGASENGLSSGTEAWKSVDGGLHYVHLPSPNQISAPVATPFPVSPAGGDVDLSTASVKNTYGIYNVYVSSLDGAHTVVSTSSDGGHIWKINPAASKFPGEDREWIAADGANKVCISYLSAAGLVLGQLGLHVECSYDAGQTFTQISDAITPTNLDSRLGYKIGNLMIDQNSNTSDPTRSNDIVYQTFTSGTVSDATNTATTGNHIVWMAVSLDGGKTFNDYQVYNNPNVAVDYGHQFANVSVDRAGNVYSFFTDDQNVYYKYSTDHGKTWLPGGPSGAPIRVSKAPANTAIFPWSVAGDPGKVDLVYYGTSYPGPSGNGCSTSTVTCQHPDNYPSSAAWNVYFAQNLSAISSPSSWTQVQASPVNHHGGVCEGGVGCTGNRDLYDDFGIAASPVAHPATNQRAGWASIIYSDDQSDQFNHTLTYPTSCTKNDTASCNHTSIATQISGPGIYGTGTGGGTGTGSGGGVDCTPSADSSKAESDAVAKMNKERTAAGMAPLASNSTTSDEARKHSCDQAVHGDPSQRGSDGSLPATRIAAAGIPFSVSAENIGLAASPLADTALATINATLLSDPTSRANILNPALKSVGVGVVYVNGAMWLTEDFTG